MLHESFWECFVQNMLFISDRQLLLYEQSRDAQRQNNRPGF